VNRIGRRIIMCMLLIAALAVIWNLLGQMRPPTEAALRFFTRELHCDRALYLGRQDC
jgi:hypothetical protein